MDMPQPASERFEYRLALSHTCVNRLGVRYIEAQPCLGKGLEICGKLIRRATVGLSSVHILEHQSTSERLIARRIFDRVGMHDYRVDPGWKAFEPLDELPLAEPAFFRWSVNAEVAKREYLVEI
jgi:hypothetical protein